MQIGTPVLLGTGAAVHSVPITTGAASPANATIIVASADDVSSAPSFFCNDQVSNSYSLIDLLGERPPNTGLFYSGNSLALPMGDTITATVDTLGNGMALACYVTGLQAVSLQDFGQNAGTGAAPSITINSSFFANPTALVVAAISIQNGASDTYTPSSGFTALGHIASATGNTILRVEWALLASGTSFWAPTLGTSRKYAAVLASFNGTTSDFFQFFPIN